MAFQGRRKVRKSTRRGPWKAIVKRVKTHSQGYFTRKLPSTQGRVCASGELYLGGDTCQTGMKLHNPPEICLCSQIIEPAKRIEVMAFAHHDRHIVGSEHVVGSRIEQHLIIFWFNRHDEQLVFA